MAASLRLGAFTAPSTRFRLAVTQAIGDDQGLMGQSLQRLGTAAELGINLLGPVVVTRGGDGVRIASTRQRAILALLTVHAGDVVSVDDLVDGVWDEESRPDNAAA